MANAQVADALAHRAIAYSVSGSTYTLTDNDFSGSVIKELIRVMAEFNFQVALVANDLVVKPA